MKRMLRLFKSLPLLVRIASIFGALFVALCIFAWINSFGTSTAPVTTDLVKGIGGSRQLVVLVHGWTRGPSQLEAVAKAALDSRPGADIMMVGYAGQIFSDADPCGIAAQIDGKIDELQKANQYDDIVLCGYSAGALLVRKAYVYGCGSVGDSPGSDRRRETVGVRKQWVDKVNRIVLLAGMNRGASIEKMGPHAKLALMVAKVTGTGHFAIECIRGAPFVANLRVQWVRTMHAAERDNLKRPAVVQLLGEVDDVVSEEDSRDVTVARDFIWTKVYNTDHYKMAVLDETPSGRERRGKIMEAFGDEDVLAELKRKSNTVAQETDDKVTEVVFVLHGIRDLGEWTSQFEPALKERFTKLNPNSDKKMEVVKSSYGYFGMGPFLLPWDRQRNVRWFMDEVTELYAKYPKLERLHFIGHSNGTYVLGSALERYVTLRVDRVVLAGSVLRRDYPWSDYTKRVTGVRNYVGSDDVVVGLGPKVFEVPGFSLLNGDLGSAGYDGFLKGTEQDFYVNGAHGAALDKRNVSSIVDFIAEGKVTRVAELQKSQRP